MRFFGLVAAAALLMLAIAPVEAAPKFLDCGRAVDSALCRQSQEQLRSEASSAERDYGAMRNVAYCLWTGCDGAVARDMKAACTIRRAIMKRHQAKVDGNDEQHFARCVQAGH